MERATTKERRATIMSPKLAEALAALKAGTLMCSRSYCRSRAVAVRSSGDPRGFCAAHQGDERTNAEIRRQRDARRRMGK